MNVLSGSRIMIGNEVRCRADVWICPATVNTHGRRGGGVVGRQN